MKSTILEGQTLDLSFLGYVNKQKTVFIKMLEKSSLAKSRHTLGIESCMSWDGFGTVLNRFWLARTPIMTKLLIYIKIRRPVGV